MGRALDSPGGVHPLCDLHGFLQLSSATHGVCHPWGFHCRHSGVGNSRSPGLQSKVDDQSRFPFGYLVGGLEHQFYFPRNLGLIIIIPIDEVHHFSEGFFPWPTNQISVDGFKPPHTLRFLSNGSLWLDHQGHRSTPSPAGGLNVVDASALMERSHPSPVELL